jgi:hypothetical protein
MYVLLLPVTLLQSSRTMLLLFLLLLLRLPIAHSTPVDTSRTTAAEGQQGAHRTAASQPDSRGLGGEHHSACLMLLHTV